MSRMLVVRFSSMGDVVAVSSLLEHIVCHDASTTVHLVTAKAYASLFAEDRRLDGCTALAGPHDDDAWRSLAAQHWDRIVDLQNSRRSRRVIARFFPQHQPSRFHKYHLRRLLLLLLRLDAYRGCLPVAGRYLQAAGYRGVEAPPLRILAREFPGDAVTSRLSGLRILALLPFCAWRNKQWPVERYAEVGRHFAAQGWRIVVAGGPADRDCAQRLAAMIGPAAFSGAGELSLAQWAWVFDRCDLAVGGDTGLVHLARGCGVPTGVLFGPTTRHFGFFPWGEPAWVVFQRHLVCRPCHAHGGNRCWRLKRPCMTTIGSDDVIDGLQRLSDRRGQVAEPADPVATVCSGQSLTGRDA